MKIFIEPHKDGIIFGVCFDKEFDIKKVKWNKFQWIKLRQFTHLISQLLAQEREIYEKDKQINKN